MPYRIKTTRPYSLESFILGRNVTAASTAFSSLFESVPLPTLVAPFPPVLPPTTLATSAARLLATRPLDWCS